MLIKNMLTGLTGALIDLGEHPGQFAKRADFPETWLYDPNEMIDPNEWARIINMAAEVFNCRDLGLRMARHISWSDLGPMWRYINRANTVSEAIAALEKYFDQFTTAAAVYLEYEGDYVAIDYDTMSWINIETTLAVELGLAIGTNEIRSMIGGAWVPEMVQFRHKKPKDLTLFHKIFGPELMFNQDRNAIILHRSTLDLPTYWNVSRTSSPKRPSAQAAQLRQYPPTHHIEQIMRSMLSAGTCNLTNLAEMFGLNPRSLQRHFKREGVCFQSILDDVRFDLASRYLAQSHLKISQISEILQFSETSSLSRFIVRRSGKTPRDFRKESVANH